MVRRATLALSLALAAACGDPTRGGPGWLATRARPVVLHPAFDTTAAVAKVISAAEGGTVSATGNDGTRYRLTVPAGALLSDAVITMIPVATLGGLPLSGGLVGAVQLEPSGLRLMKPATLAIRPTKEIPVAEQVSLGWYGGGNDAHRYPLSPDPRRMEFRLLHFSGYGVGRAPANDPGRGALQQAHDSEARLQSRVADIIDRERTAQERGEPSGESGPELRKAMIEYYDTGLRPLMQIAETDDRMASCCLRRYFGWEREIQLLGMDPPAPDPKATRVRRPSADEVELERRRAEGHTSALKIIANVYDKAGERALARCRTEHDLTAIDRLLSLEREMQLLGGSTDASTERTAKAFREMLKCLSFEVEFDSRFDNRVPNGQLLHHVQARASVNGGDSTSVAVAQGPTAYVEHTTDMTEATLRAPTGQHSVFTAFGFLTFKGIATKPGTFSVHRVDWNRNPIDPEGVDCDGKDTDRRKTIGADTVTIAFQTGVPTDVGRATYRFTPPATLTNHTWASFWARAHETAKIADAQSRDAPDQNDPIYRLALPQSEPGVWRVDFTRTGGGGAAGAATLAETGHLIVRHAPK